MHAIKIIYALNKGTAPSTEVYNSLEFIRILAYRRFIGIPRNRDMAQNDSVVGGPTTVVDLAAKDRPRTALKPEMYSKWSGAEKGCYVPSAAPKKVTISVAEGATPVSGTWKSCQPGTTSSFSTVCSSNRGIGESVDREAGKAEREKYLTAKYPKETDELHSKAARRGGLDR